jgi:hypothetical protein
VKPDFIYLGGMERMNFYFTIWRIMVAYWFHRKAVGTTHKAVVITLKAVMITRKAVVITLKAVVITHKAVGITLLAVIDD